MLPSFLIDVIKFVKITIIFKAHSFKCPLIFFNDCVTIYERFCILLNFLFSFDASPASVHTTSLESSKSCIICFSNGFNVVCSFEDGSAEAFCA